METMRSMTAKSPFRRSETLPKEYRVGEDRYVGPNGICIHRVRALPLDPWNSSQNREYVSLPHNPRVTHSMVDNVLIKVWHLNAYLDSITPISEHYPMFVRPLPGYRTGNIRVEFSVSSNLTLFSKLNPVPFHLKSTNL